MLNRYLFGNWKSESVLDSSVLVEDGVSWDHQVQEPTIYTEEDENNSGLENNNETYMTANDGHDDTQYFSILDTEFWSPDLTGFVQTSEGGVVKSKVLLKPSLIVNLSDSKGKKRKIPEIVITNFDDESSSGNVVQIDLSRDSDGEKKEEKRKRGRPLKKPLIDTDDPVPVKTLKEPENKENEKDAEPKPTWQCLNQLTPKYDCQTCKDRFKNQILLNNHVKKAHVENNKKTSPKMITNPWPNKCAYCAKTFSIPVLLNAHMRTHKLFTCSTCSAQFISKFALDNHVQKLCVKLRKPSSPSDSNMPQLTTLKCNLCSINFLTNKALYYHKVREHELKTPDRDAVFQNSTKKKLLRSA